MPTPYLWSITNNLIQPISFRHYQILGTMLEAANQHRITGTQILLSLNYLHDQPTGMCCWRYTGGPIFIWIIGEWKKLTLNKPSQQSVRMIIPFLQTQNLVKKAGMQT